MHRTNSNITGQTIKTEEIIQEEVSMAKLQVKEKCVDTLDANDPKCQFRNTIDILNECFGLNRKANRRASYPQSGPTGDKWIAGTRGEKFFVWMPKLYSNTSEWGNSINDDGTIIYEIAEPGRNEDYLFTAGNTKPAFYMNRLVFAKESTEAHYRFVGVFVADSYEYKRHVFRRIATRVKLIGNPVTRIEILDSDL